MAGNLGGFAGGFAAGWQNMEAIKLKKREQDREDKSAQSLDRYRTAAADSMANDDRIKSERATREKTDWDRGNALKTELETYGRDFGVDASGKPMVAEPQAPAQPQATLAQGAPGLTLASVAGQQQPAMSQAPAATRNLAAGNLAQPAAAQQQPAQGMDAATWLKYNTGRLAILMRHSAEPEVLKAAHEYVKKLEGDEKGRTLLAAVGGDKTALAKFAADNGTTPDKIRFTADPKTGRQLMDLGNGTGPQDVTQALHILSGANAYAAITATSDRKDGDQKHNLELRKGESLITLQGAQANNANASANLHNAQAAVAGQQKLTLADERKQTALDKRLNSAFGKTVDATDFTGKTEWMFGKNWTMGRVASALEANPKADHNKVFSEALTAYRQIQRATQETMARASGDKAKMKLLTQRYGSADPAVISQRMLEENLERN